MPRRALRLTVDLPDLSIPLLADSVLIEQEDGSVTVAVSLPAAAAEPVRRRFLAAQAERAIVPDRKADEAA